MRGLIAAGAGAHLQEDVAVVLRILRHQQTLQLEFLGRDARRQVGEFFLAQLLGGGVLVRREFAGDRQVAFERDEAPVALDQRPQSRVLHGQFAELVLTRNDAGVREQAADFLESFVQFLELAPDGVFHGRGL